MSTIFEQLSAVVSEDRLPRGFRGASATCGIKKSGKPDIGLIVSDTLASAAVMATNNRFAAPPVQVTRAHARGGQARAFVVNSGNANAATGEQGMHDAWRMCELVGQGIGADKHSVFVNSTGVIGVPLPMEKIEAGISTAVRNLSLIGLNDAAVGILTTDRGPKRTAAQWEQDGKQVRVFACAKGVGMIHPNMATLISTVLTDATIAPSLLHRMLHEAVEHSFNCLTVDGDTSTNDMTVALANGASGAAEIQDNSKEYKRLLTAMTDSLQALARGMAADGEGASRLATIRVEGARSFDEARTIGRAVGTSSLVKTAIHGADPNWGRICMAMGNSSVDFDPEKIVIKVAGVTLYRRGTPVTGDVPQAAEAMKAPEVEIVIDLGHGSEAATVWASSLTEEYVRFNSAYTT